MQTTHVAGSLVRSHPGLLFWRSSGIDRPWSVFQCHCIILLWERPAHSVDSISWSFARCSLLALKDSYSSLWQPVTLPAPPGFSGRTSPTVFAVQMGEAPRTLSVLCSAPTATNPVLTREDSRLPSTGSLLIPSLVPTIVWYPFPLPVFSQHFQLADGRETHERHSYGWI